jgi:hypothetical protein
MKLNARKFLFIKIFGKIFDYQLFEALEVTLLPLTRLARSTPLLLFIFELFKAKPLQAININVNFVSGLFLSILLLLNVNKSYIVSIFDNNIFFINPF